MENIINKKLDLITFIFENEFNIYKSTFYLNYLQSLLSSNYSIDEMINYLLNYIDNNKISIEEKEKEKYLKLILLNNNNNIELIIKGKSKLNEETIEKINSRK